MEHGTIEAAGRAATSRLDLWTRLIEAHAARTCAEVGVFRGEFAEHVLRRCSVIERYYLIDPWRHLGDWNKPANRSDEEFSDIKAKALARTSFAGEKRVVLQGRTTEVARELPDAGLDLAYVDGDHTLRGITIDLIRLWPKMKPGGLLGGDDFCRSVWQHPSDFEPTVVFPQAVYFAEAVGATIYALPFRQFAIMVNEPGEEAFTFRDLTGEYSSTELLPALRRPLGEASARAWRELKRRIRRRLAAERPRARGG